VTDVPEISMRVSEYRLHSLSCASCGSSTKADLQARAERAARRIAREAMVASCTGDFHLLLSAELIAGGIGADRSGSVRDGVRVAIKFAARSEAV